MKDRKPEVVPGPFSRLSPEWLEHCYKIGTRKAMELGELNPTAIFMAGLRMVAHGSQPGTQVSLDLQHAVHVPADAIPGCRLATDEDPVS